MGVTGERIPATPTAAAEADWLMGDRFVGDATVSEERFMERGERAESGG